MGYPGDYGLEKLVRQLREYGNLMHEYAAEGMDTHLQAAHAYLCAAIDRMRALPADASLAAKEPDDLGAIKALRAHGPRRMWKKLDSAYEDKLEGAMLARFAGCTLGAPVEFWSVEEMENWAKYIGFGFPPESYWPKIKSPNNLRYGVSPCEAYTSDELPPRFAALARKLYG